MALINKEEQGKHEKEALKIELDKVRQKSLSAKNRIPNFLPNNEKKSNCTIVPKRLYSW
jgi:hypothetical protein